MPGIRRVTGVQCELGEGPLWSSADSALYWIDILGQHIYRLDDGAAEPQRWDLPAKPGCIALRRGGGLMVAMKTGVHTIDLATGQLTLVVDPEPDRPGNRLNDGAADARGRFWIGSMDDEEKAVSGALYRIDADGSCTRVLDQLGVSNGIGWSPDGATMYHTDSSARTITAYDFDVESGSIGRPRTFAEDHDCSPDGLTVDADGFVWSAKYNGWRVVRYDPDGTVERVVQLPVQRPSCPAFGGPELDRLYITSASAHLSGAALAEGPLAGSLLVLDEPGAVGLPEPACLL
jgi:sugar lactone lactonase YvrE